MNLFKNKSKKKTISFRFHRMKLTFNLGILLFLIIFIYMVCVFINYFTAHKISTYEVGYGSTITDTFYTGIALREETVIKTSDSGFVQFYYIEGSRVSAGNYIYTLSESNISTFLESNTNVEYTLSTSDTKTILTAIQSFNSSFNPLSYDAVYHLEDTLYNVVQNSENVTILNSIESMLNGNLAIDIFDTETVGIISYQIDGYENITSETFDASIFDYANYINTSIESGQEVGYNTSIYKLITDDWWNIVLELSPADKEILEELSTVKLKFLSDNEIVTAEIELVNIDEKDYAIITLYGNMIRYLDERFIDIELILDELEGFKIPITSVTTNEFFQIPLTYVTRGGENSSNGVVVNNYDGTVTFQAIDIFFQDSDSVYIFATEEFMKKTLIEEETSNQIRLLDTVELPGVYVINKGYAEFTYISILAETSEYYIVDELSTFSLRNFDHIALYGESVHENAIIN